MNATEDQSTSRTPLLAMRVLLWVNLLGSLLVVNVGAYVLTLIIWLLVGKVKVPGPFSSEGVGVFLIFLFLSLLVLLAGYAGTHKNTLQLLAGDGVVRVWQRNIPRVIFLIIFFIMFFTTYHHTV